MSPFRRSIGYAATLCFLVGSAVNTPAQGHSTRPSPTAVTRSQSTVAPVGETTNKPHDHLDPVTRRGFDHFYNMEYDAAIRDFEQVLQARPDDPYAINHLASAVLFRELYRIGALDTGLYSGTNKFLDKKIEPDAKECERIRALTDRAIKLSEARLDANEKDVEAFYSRGVARGLRSTYLALVEKAWFSGLRSAIGARHDHERVLELDPDYTDAKMIVGVHNYVAGSLPWAVKVAISMVGLNGSKSKGLEYLREVARDGSEAVNDAKIALGLFLRREQQYDEAITVVRTLIAAYPRNYLFALEEANLLNASGRGREAIGVYRRVLDLASQKRFVTARLELAWLGLGEAARGQRDFQTAADAYDNASRLPGLDVETAQRANLAAGEMYDVLEKRELATRKYQAVINADPDSKEAETARKRLKQPYRIS